MNWLWMFLPDEVLPLIIAGIGISLIVGVINRQAAFRLLGILFLSVLLAPFIEGFVSGLPLILILLLLAIIGLSMIKGVSAMLIGKEATDHVVGNLATEFIKLLLKLIFLPFRLIWWGVRGPGQRQR